MTQIGFEGGVVGWFSRTPQPQHPGYTGGRTGPETDSCQTSSKWNELEFGPNHSCGLSSRDSILLLVRHCVLWICPFTTDTPAYWRVDVQKQAALFSAWLEWMNVSCFYLKHLCMQLENQKHLSAHSNYNKYDETSSVTFVGLFHLLLCWYAKKVTD